jgi:hypothetical protein
MALINCPECKHQVSDQAPTCPQCGTPIKGTSRNGTVTILLSGEGLQPITKATIKPRVKDAAGKTIYKGKFEELYTLEVGGPTQLIIHYCDALSTPKNLMASTVVDASGSGRYKAYAVNIDGYSKNYDIKKMKLRVDKME